MNLIILILGSLLVTYITLVVCETFKYNSEHKSYDKELDFCRSVYESDKVVLQQCEKYFVILH